MLWNGGPESLATIGDVAETEAIQNRGTDQDQGCSCECDSAEGSADAADAEFIQSLAAVQATSQARPLHHESLQKGGDRHQSQPSSEDHHGEHGLAETGEISPHINDRQAGDRDRGCGCEQGLPKPDLRARTERCGQEQCAEQDHQKTCDHGELRHRQSPLPSLAACEDLTEGHVGQGQIITRATSVDQVGP